MQKELWIQCGKKLCGNDAETAAEKVPETAESAENVAAAATMRQKLRKEWKQLQEKFWNPWTNAASMRKLRIAKEILATAGALQKVSWSKAWTFAKHICHGYTDTALR